LDATKNYINIAEFIAYSLVAIIEVLEEESSSVSYALESKEKTQWLHAMNEDRRSLHLNNT